MSINKNLKELRLQRKLTQGELAELAKIELTQVSRIERGASEPKLETIKKLAIALKCTSDELIMEKGSSPTEPQYLKVILKRINDLSPLKRYVILDMLQAYLNLNQANDHLEIEKYGSQTMSENDYEFIMKRNELNVLDEEHKIIDEIGRETNEKATIIAMDVHKK